MGQQEVTARRRAGPKASGRPCRHPSSPIRASTSLPRNVLGGRRRQDLTQSAATRGRESRAPARLFQAANFCRGRVRAAV